MHFYLLQTTKNYYFEFTKIKNCFPIQFTNFFESNFILLISLNLIAFFD